jgi:hypothetical protein
MAEDRVAVGKIESWIRRQWEHAGQQGFTAAMNVG